jgi:hypothetical protein
MLYHVLLNSFKLVVDSEYLFEGGLKCLRSGCLFVPGSKGLT